MELCRKELIQTHAFLKSVRLHLILKVVEKQNHFLIDELLSVKVFENS